MATTESEANDSEVSMVSMVKCGQCGGSGSLPSLDHEERDREIEDACYHCGNSGMVDEETARNDRRAAFAQRLAVLAVNEEIAACDEDEHGEGWTFRAAEHGLSRSDYTTQAVWAETDRIMDELSKLDERTLDLLVDATEGLALGAALRDRRERSRREEQKTATQTRLDDEPAASSASSIEDEEDICF